MNDRKKSADGGGGSTERADGRAAAMAGVVASLTLEERARLSGVYGVSCLGPREHERDAYVRVRDELESARSWERNLAWLASRRVAGRSRLRRVVVAVATAIGLASVSLTPAMARTNEQLMTVRAQVASLGAELAGFVLEEKWADAAPNLVTTVGGNLGLDTILAGSAYTTVGPFLGLINTNANLSVIADTMGSHAAWLEVGTTNLPTYTAPRKTVAFSAASAKSKAASAASSFAITGPGTVGGCFLVTGSGAVSTIDSTAGTLYSAGAFTGGSKVVANGDTLNVTYTATI